MSEITFVDGLIVKAPNENAPDYVKAKLSIKNAELIAFLQARLNAGEEWTNADVKVSQAGKWYSAVDDWKPNGGTSGARGGARERPHRQDRDTIADTEVDESLDSFADDDIPF